MRNSTTNYSNFNSIDIYQELNKLSQVPQGLISRAREILLNPRSTNKPFDGRGLATLIYRLAKKRYRAEDKFMEIWQQAAIRSIRSFNPQELANSIYAFGVLGIKPSQAFVGIWEQAAIGNIRSFKPQELANSIYAFGVLGIKPSQAFVGIWEQAAIGNIRSFNSQNLANSIYAFGVLGIKPSQAFVGIWEQAAIRSIGNFKPQNLANSIYAFGVLGIKPSQGFLVEWQEAAIRSIGNFNPQDLANSIYDFGVLGIKPSQGFLVEWQEAAIRSIENFKPQNLANSIYAFGVLGIKPSTEFLGEWEQAAIRSIRSFNPQDLANSIYAFGVLGIKPSQGFLVEWQEAAIRSIGNFNPQDLANSIYALMLMQKVMNVEFVTDRQILLFINELKTKPQISLEGMGVLSISRLVYCGEKASFDISPTHGSDLQRRVYICVKNLYPNAEEEKYFSLIGTSVDIYLEINGKKVVVQVDGPSHFFNDANSVWDETPKTLFNTWLLKSFCGVDDVVRMPYFTIEFLNDIDLHSRIKDHLELLYPPKKKGARSCDDTDSTENPEPPSKQSWVARYEQELVNTAVVLGNGRG
jgi:hypothetical protein